MIGRHISTDTRTARRGAETERRHGPPRGGDAARPEDGDGLFPPFLEGTIRRERPRAMGVTQERPLRRKTAGFGGVAPGTTGGAIGPPDIFAEGAIRPANAGRNGASTGPLGCDSGCDKGAVTESHAGAAN